MANTRRSSGERFKYGICLNDECPKCKEKTVQQIAMRKEFVCEDCGKELRECPPPKKGTNMKLIGIIGGAVLVVGLGVGGYFAFSGDKSTPAVEETEVKEAPAVEEAEVMEEAPEIINEADQTAPAVKQDTPKKSTSSNTSLPYGSYSGPTQGGVPHGVGGTINVSSSYQIDLKDGRGSMLDIRPGDKIANTKFENGRLRAGELQRTDGTRKWFNC